MPPPEPHSSTWPPPAGGATKPSLTGPPASGATPGAAGPKPKGPISDRDKKSNFRDALVYLDLVKAQFRDRLEVYTTFLDIMKEFKSHTIDTPGVIDRVTVLFKGHSSLIRGFNPFLPPNYRIECQGPEGDEDGLITVSTPHGTITRQAGEFSAGFAAVQQQEREKVAPAPVTEARPPLLTGPPPTLRPPCPSVSPVPLAGAAPGGSTSGAAAETLASSGRGRPSQNQPDFDFAIAYVNKVKRRFHAEPAVYQEFLEILRTFKAEGGQGHLKIAREVYARAAKLFSSQPDLMDDFEQFFGEEAGSFSSERPSVAPSSLVASRSGSSTPKNAFKNQVDLEANGPQAKKPKFDHPPVLNQALRQNQPRLPSIDEKAFFERVKAYLQDENAYQEFLKLLHLFVQDTLDKKALLERAALYIEKSGELWALFKDIVAGGAHTSNRIGTRSITAANGADEAEVPKVVEVSSALKRPRVDLDSCKAYGASYRKLPRTEIDLPCTGRDKMCWEVLNDEWVSHPTSLSEDAVPSVAHKKNMYEDALHRAEEERHEYDYHIQANLRAIALLEPIAERIETMSPVEKQAFRLKPGLGGQSKSIYQRIIKKIYGPADGLVAIDALHTSPAIAVPVVLARLLAKDVEWKRAQREWSKVWREVDAKNFYKSLDHQGINFKLNDKKVILPKSLVAEIESLRKEQVQRREALLDPTVGAARETYQYSYKIEDISVLQDLIKLILSYLDRAPGAMSTNDREGVEDFLRDFIPTFFHFDRAEFDLAIDVPEAPSDDGEGEGGVMSDTANSLGDDEDDGGSTSGRKLKKVAGDLRKKVLRGAVVGGLTSETLSRDTSSTPVPLALTEVSVSPSPAVVPASSPPSPAPGPESGVMDIDTPVTVATVTATATPAPEETISTVLTSSGVEVVKKATSPSPSPSPSTSPATGPIAGPPSTPSKPPSVASSTAPDSSFKAVMTVDPTSAWIATQEDVLTDPNGSRASSVEREALMTDFKERVARPARKVNMFANSSIYCLFRLLQMLYNRLESLKAIGDRLAAQRAEIVNPLALKLGLDDVGGPLSTTGDDSNSAVHFYDHLLSLCEKLFDNEIDQSAFEEAMRFMFGTRAFISFTLDKLVAAVVKQVLHVTSDAKSRELVRLLELDRERSFTDARQQIHYRQTAELVVGAEENLYRIEWVDESDSLLIQLLGADDVTVDEDVTAEERWKTYLESYTLSNPTAGLPARVLRPFLRRNKQPLPPSPHRGTFIAESGLEVKVCIGSYKLVYVEDSSDFFQRRITAEAEAQRRAKIERNRIASKGNIEAFLATKEVVEALPIMADGEDKANEDLTMTS